MRAIPPPHHAYIGQSINRKLIWQTHDLESKLGLSKLGSRADFTPLPQLPQTPPVSHTWPVFPCINSIKRQAILDRMCSTYKLRIPDRFSIEANPVNTKVICTYSRDGSGPQYYYVWQRMHMSMRLQTKHLVKIFLKQVRKTQKLEVKEHGYANT